MKTNEEDRWIPIIEKQPNVFINKQKFLVIYFNRDIGYEIPPFSYNVMAWKPVSKTDGKI